MILVFVKNGKKNNKKGVFDQSVKHIRIFIASKILIYKKQKQKKDVNNEF
jgi:hypothetical protein